MNWLKTFLANCLSGTCLYLIVFAVGMASGGFSVGLYWRTQIADLKNESAQAANLYQDDLRKKEREYAERLAQATDAKQAEIDRLNCDIVSLRTDADRLRVAASRSRAVSRKSGDSCEPYKRQVSECVGLLSEGAGLFEEGGGLLRDFNADREAVRKLNAR